MEIDVVYLTSSKTPWEYINQYVRPEAIDLALFKASEDALTNKKTIWNAVRRLAPSGIFCIQVTPENISNMIKLITEKGLKHKVTYFDFTWVDENSVITFLIAYKSLINKPDISTLVKLESYDEMASKIINLSNFGDTILCLGDDSFKYIHKAKILGRQVIAFGENANYAEQAKQQGMKEVII